MSEIFQKHSSISTMSFLNDNESALRKDEQNLDTRDKLWPLWGNQLPDFTFEFLNILRSY